MYMCICMLVCVCVYVCMCVSTYVCVCVCVSIHMCMYVCTALAQWYLNAKSTEQFYEPDDTDSKLSSKGVRQNSLIHCLFHSHTIFLCSSSIHSLAPCLHGDVK